MKIGLLEFKKLSSGLEVGITLKMKLMLPLQTLNGGFLKWARKLMYAFYNLIDFANLLKHYYFLRSFLG